jgi:hypothetical protein
VYSSNCHYTTAWSSLDYIFFEFKLSNQEDSLGYCLDGSRIQVQVETIAIFKICFWAH